ncbi:MAG: hypothetical protein IJ493_05630 [Clostridia bacterium]|nr:hypothetical protein [Clostridia bacterium]
MTPLHSMRVAYENWIDHERFCELLRLLRENPCGIHQLSLFTSAAHAPLTLDETKRRTEILRERMKEARGQGLSSGINILATIGHHEEDLDHSLTGDYRNMTGEDGRVCRGSYCMNDERFLDEYIRPVYRMLVEAEPDYIWIDDDIRNGHMPIGNGCWCDGCIEKFNRVNNTSYTRATLLEALNSGDMAIRRAWLNHNSAAITRLLRLIGKTVREINPQIMLGLMTGERYHEGYTFGTWAAALSDDGKYPIMWRPGGGAYDDFWFDGILGKIESIGRQSSLLPSYVTIVQSEVENFPYQLIKKTPTSTALEGALAMTAGCSGVAFNILPSETGEPLTTIEPHLRAIDRLLPFYELLAEKTAGLQPTGIHTGWRPYNQLIVPRGRYNQQSGGMYAQYAHEMFQFGLPQCYTPENAVVTLLTGQSTAAWTDEEIASLLEGGVYMNIGALTYLNSRGFGGDTGFTAGNEIPVDAREIYTDHPLNRGLAGCIRNGRQAFNRGDAYALLPSGNGAEVLAAITDYHENITADCCLGLYENARGGRVCTAGYYPFNWISDYSKTIQLKRLMVWLSGERLPSYVDSYHRIFNHTFVKGSHCVAALCNPTNEHLENVRVAIRTEADSAVCRHQDMTAVTLRGVMPEEGEKYRIFTVDKLPPYEMVLLEV